MLAPMNALHMVWQYSPTRPTFFLCPVYLVGNPPLILLCNASTSCVTHIHSCPVNMLWSQHNFSPMYLSIHQYVLILYRSSRVDLMWIPWYLPIYLTPISSPTTVQYTLLYPHMRTKCWAHMRTNIRMYVRTINTIYSLISSRV